MNSLAASQSGGRISSLVTPEDKLAMTVEDPLAVVAGNHFEGKFTERPSETSLNYINLPRGRRIVPVDALSWVAPFNAGYEPTLDCSAVSCQDCFTPWIFSCITFSMHSLDCTALQGKRGLFRWDALPEFYLALLFTIPLPTSRMYCYLTVPLSIPSMLT